MRLVIFDIQNPTDPQVNGFGIYRTVVDGTEPMLIGRFEIPQYPHYSHTHPWESADCVGVEDTELTLNFAKGSVNSIGSDPAAFCTMTQVWEALGSQSFHLNSDDSNGYVCTYPWEMRGEWGAGDLSPVTQTRFTWALTTLTIDTGLGDAVETDHDLPPAASLVAEFQESLFLAGDDVNPHYLWWSKRFHPESWPAANFLEVGDANDPITALVPIAGILGVFTRDTKYRVNGNAGSGFIHFEAISHRGTRAYKSALATEFGVIFVANDGVYTTNLIGADQKISGDIESLFNPENLNEQSTRLEEPINQAYAHLISASYHKSKYRFVYVAGTDETEINREAVFDFDIKKWTLNTLDQSSYLVEEDLDYLTGGGQDGKLYRLNDGQNDNGSLITYTWTSKDFPGPSQVSRNIYCYIKVDAHIPVGNTMTVNFFVDDEFVSSATITDHRTCVLNPLPENTQGHKWRVQITGSSLRGGIVLYGFTTYYIPLEGLANGT